jgi:hypothetical protein
MRLTGNVRRHPRQRMCSVSIPPIFEMFIRLSRARMALSTLRPHDPRHGSMDETRFDALARSLGTAGSRRRALGGLLLGALVLVGSQADETAAHDALKSCKKKSGKQKKKCIKKAKAHNAQHAGEGLSSGDTGNRTPVDPCAGVTCGPVPQAMSACQNGVCVVTSCQGSFYDVDGDVTNGCEAPDDTTASHNPLTATYVGQLQCITASSSASFGGKIVSDNRAHDPEPEGFVPATGSAPDHWFADTPCPDGVLEGHRVHLRRVA